MHGQNHFKFLSSGFIRICSLNSDEICYTLSDCAILVVFRYYKNICYSFISYILSVREIEKSHTHTHTHTHKMLSGEKYRSEQLFFRRWSKAWWFWSNVFLSIFLSFFSLSLFSFPAEKVYQQTFILKIRCIIRLFRALLNRWISSSQRVETRGWFAAIPFNVKIL